MALSGNQAPRRGNSAVVRYSRTAIALHWILAAAVIAQLALGWWMLDIPKSPPGLRAGWFNVHKSIGMTIACVAAVRLAWRVTHPVPDADLGPSWRRAAARLSHRLLYVCMLLMPAAGFLGSSFTRYPIKFFGMTLPTPHVDWPAGKEFMSDIHYLTACVFVALVSLHVAAALWHWLQRDGVTARIGIPSPR